jgi:hypothetical protein
MGVGITQSHTGKCQQLGKGELHEGRWTYRTKSNGGGGQAYQASVSCMRLVDGIGEIITELVENSLDPGVVLAGDELADDTL